MRPESQERAGGEGFVEQIFGTLKWLFRAARSRFLGQRAMEAKTALKAMARPCPMRRIGA